VVVLQTRQQSLVAPDQEKAFFRIVKAGFSAKRKKLRSSLSGGLGISKTDAEELLVNAKISPDARAEDLAIDDWLHILWKYTVRIGRSDDSYLRNRIVIKVAV